MNTEKISERRRKVENYHLVTITDDFGNVLQLGDHVDMIRTFRKITEDVYNA